MRLTKLINNEGVPLMKRDPFSLGAAALLGGTSIVGSALGGLFGSSSQRSANDANLTIARENNQMQMDMFNRSLEFNERMSNQSNEFNAAEAQKLRDWQERMYYTQRKYDTPLAQMERYRQAGINPYFAMGNIQGGNVQGSFGGAAAAGSAATAPGVPSLSSPTMQAYNPTDAIMQGVNGLHAAAGVFYEGKLKSEQAKNIAIDNITKLQRDRAELSKVKAEMEKTKADTSSITKQIAWIDKRAEAELRQLSANTDFAYAQKKLTEEQQRLTAIQADYQNMVTEAFPAKNAKEMAEIHSRIQANGASAYASVQSGRLSVAQAATEAVNKSVRELEKEGVKIDNRRKSGMIYYEKKLIRTQIELNKQKRKIGLPDELYGEQFRNNPAARIIDAYGRSVGTPFRGILR